MKTAQRSTVVGVFRDKQQAQKAVDELLRAGFRENQIGVVTQSTESAATTNNAGSKTAEGAAIGAATGAGVGLLWGLGIAAQIFPPLGIVAGGTLLALLASAGTGAGVSAIIGALVGLGIPEDEATYYENEVKSGHTVVTVNADGYQDKAWDILSRCGAYNRNTATTTATAAQAGDQTMQVHEEELRAAKTPVQAGEVKVRKEVHTEHRTLDVPVRREEVVVERHPVTGHAASASDIRPGEEIRIPVTEEQVHVEKRPVVKEEVTVGKREVQQTERVSGDVRKEEVKVERKGDVNVRDTRKGK
jgi:uncharacterized protein (TIGR02271 family)